MIKRSYFEVKFSKWLGLGGLSPFTLVAPLTPTSKSWVRSKNVFTYEVPVPILLTYISLSRHIRKDMLMRRIITSDLGTV